MVQVVWLSHKVGCLDSDAHVEAGDRALGLSKAENWSWDTCRKLELSKDYIFSKGELDKKIHSLVTRNNLGSGKVEKRSSHEDLYPQGFFHMGLRFKMYTPCKVQESSRSKN